MLHLCERALIDALDELILDRLIRILVQNFIVGEQVLFGSSLLLHRVYDLTGCVIGHGVVDR